MRCDGNVRAATCNVASVFHAHAQLVSRPKRGQRMVQVGPPARQALLLPGIASSCPVNFAWPGHPRTRRNHSTDEKSHRALHALGVRWPSPSTCVPDEIHALFCIRESGHDD